MQLFRKEIRTVHIVTAGCLLTLLYALFSRGVYHPDEHFQILEYARMRLFGTSSDELPWEYGLMMRPGFQPLMAYLAGRLLEAAGLYSPWTLATMLRLLSGAFSVAAVMVFYREIRQEPQRETEAKRMLALSLLLWFMAYTHVRFSSETLSGNLLLLTTVCCMRFRRTGNASFGSGLLVGLLAGTAFIVRYQTGFALLGLGLWLAVFDRNLRRIAGAVIGGTVMLGVGTLCDRWLYGRWTCAPVNYFRENIVHAHAAGFGVDPWWYYLTGIPLEGIVLFGLPVLLATGWFIYKNPRHLIVWTIVPFLVAHQAVGHKEVRFLFPLLPFVPLFLVRAAESLPVRWLRSRTAGVLGGVLIALNAGIVLYNLTVSNTDTYFYRMNDRFCRHKEKVVVLSLRSEKTYYGYPENVIGPRTVTARFYMPPAFDYRTFGTAGELGRQAERLCRECTEVYLLTEQPAPALPATVRPDRVAWSPYPRWVTTYFNFNDWAGLSIRTKNVFRLSPAGNRPSDEQ